MKIAVTGANSSVGQNLLAHIAEHTEFSVVAGIRSESAKATLPSSPQITPQIIAYDDIEALATTLSGVDCVVHLAGILIENKHTSYTSANVEATAAVCKAANKAGVKHVVFISVVGANERDSNAYFRSKGAAEQVVANCGISSSVIRTPILLGPSTAGAKSLVGAASSGKTKVLGGGNYSMRPLDIDDLNQAILNCCENKKSGAALYELVGPEPITYRDLIKRTAAMLDKEVEIGSIPIFVAKLGARVTSLIKGGGISPIVIDVITMDEVVNKNADQDLGVSLTPLKSTLEKILK